MSYRSFLHDTTSNVQHNEQKTEPLTLLCLMVLSIITRVMLDSSEHKSTGNSRTQFNRHCCICAGPPTFEVPQETGQEIIDKFRLQQGLLLTVRPEQPVNLSIEQLRRLSWEEHSAVWRDYVNALAQCLVSMSVFYGQSVSV